MGRVGGSPKSTPQALTVGTPRRTPWRMAAKPPADPAAQREAKLAQALRANLRRRKAGDRPPAAPVKDGGNAD